MSSRLIVNFVGNKFDKTVYSSLLRKNLPKDSCILLKESKKNPTLVAKDIFTYHPDIKTIITVQEEFFVVPGIPTVNFLLSRKHDKIYKDIRYDPSHELNLRHLFSILDNLNH